MHAPSHDAGLPFTVVFGAIGWATSVGHAIQPICAVLASIAACVAASAQWINAVEARRERRRLRQLDKPGGR